MRSCRSLFQALACGVLVFCAAALMSGGNTVCAAPAAVAPGADPVVVQGASLVSFKGAPIGQLFVYAYSAAGDTWAQVPWQFDERDGTGSYKAVGNGVLDNDDELVVMGFDLGDQAPAGGWVADLDSRSYARYEVVATDPSQPANAGRVYVYRSSTLVKTNTTDYVSSTGYAITAESYVQGLVAGKLITDRLELNGTGVSFLDRTKVRLTAPGGTMKEEDLAFGDWYLIRDGQVRAITQYMTGTPPTTVCLSLSNYATMLHMAVSLDLRFLFGETVTSFRFSADMAPAASGGVYYDANTAGGVPLDGVPDAVPAAPLSPWNQASHPTAGSIVQVLDVSPLGGVPQTYYKDDSALDPADTGDQMSYSDCGAHVPGASANLAFRAWYYVLPAASPNVGAAYAGYAQNPMHVGVFSSSYTHRPDFNKDGKTDILWRSG